MNLFNQKIFAHTFDTFTAQFLVDTTNLSSYDSVWWGVSLTPGGSYVLQKANNQFDYGLPAGDATSFITQPVTNGTPDLQLTTIAETSFGFGTGAGVELIITLDSSGNLSTSTGTCEIGQGGQGYGYPSLGTEIFVNGSEFGGSFIGNFKIVIPQNRHINPSYFPPFTEDIYISAFQDIYPPVLVYLTINQKDFNTIGDPKRTYYWELVGGKTTTYSLSAGYYLSSQVMAAGTLNVIPSLFSKSGLRP